VGELDPGAQGCILQFLDGCEGELGSPRRRVGVRLAYMHLDI